MIQPIKFKELLWWFRGQTEVCLMCDRCFQMDYVPGCYVKFRDKYYCEKCIKAELTVRITRNEAEAKKVDVCLDLLKRKYGDSILLNLRTNYASQ